jgi:PAS domain S-box-containing protein
MLLASLIFVGAQGSPSPPFTSREEVRPPEESHYFEPLAVNAQSPAAPARKAILLLFPYQYDLPYSMLAVQAIREEFGKASDLTLDVYYEYMDLNRFPDDAYRQQLLSLYAAKYRHKPIDLVLVADEVTLNLWLEQRGEISPNAPVVFYDILTTRVVGRQFPQDVTGVSAIVDYTPSVNWVLRARPSVNEIVIVHGVGEADRTYIYAIDEMKAALRGRVRLTDLSDLPLAEIKRRVAALPQSSVVLYHLMFEDAAGVKYRPIDALRELAGVSAVPVICGYDQFIGTGAIGGHVYSIEQQARYAARAGLRILRGEPASAIPIMTGEGDQFMLDYPALQRYGIPLSTLPPESVVKNREPSLWERYRPQMIAIGAGFAVLILLVAFLVGLTRRLNTTRLALSRLNATLETQVQERTATLSQTNRRLEAEIAERVQAETALQASETRYRLLADNAPLAVTVTDVETSQVVYTNPMAAALFETTVAQGLGTHALDYYADPHDRERLVRQLTAQGYVNDFEVRVKKQTGQEFWASITSTLSMFENRPAIHTVYLDITERKRAEEVLRQSEAQYRLLAENMVDVIWILNPAGQFTYVSPSVKRLRGYTPEEVLSQSPAEALTPASLQTMQAALTATMPEIERGAKHYELKPAAYELEQPRKYGSTVWTEALVKVLFDDNGNFSGFLGVSRDITERKQAEAEREQLIAELQEALAKVEQLEGILPICSFCKKIRDEDGKWQVMETYIGTRSRVEFSHGFCPDCARKHYPEYFTGSTEE